MADVDEDAIPKSAPIDDVEDEIQDFRFLANLSNNCAKIPKRGEKDFEPHETNLQSQTLAASRQAMYDALSARRIHAPKSHNVATYHPATNMAYTINPKGPLFVKIGKVLAAKEDPFGDQGLRGQRVWLLPEEVLYLIDRGTVDVRWPTSEDKEEDEEGLVMSVQGAYATFLGSDVARTGHLTMDRYTVYSNLKRAGYTVMRAPSWSGMKSISRPSQHTFEVGLSCARKAWRSLWKENDREPLVGPGIFRNYTDVYRRLALIEWYDPTRSDHVSSSDCSMHVAFHVWKPGSTRFKKSDPGSPDYRIVVVDGRETTLPSLEELDTLMSTLPDDWPRDDAQLHMKLKHGYRNVVLAVVDQGVVSYLTWADAAFGKEKLYERKA
ncbi:hypothetical protein K470DRAFT_202833, partial [Piedraia hortae CBS 480.64]